MQEEFTDLFRGMIGAFDEVAPEMAQAQRKYYEELVDAGFTEEQAFEMVNKMDLNANSE